MVLLFTLSVGLLLIVYTACLLLFKGIKNDSMEMDLRTLWDGYPPRTTERIRESFR